MNIIEKLHKQAMLCEQCSLHKTRKSVVFGDGSWDADIMFVGEAPGADEDEQGLPFIGRTGRLLRATIDAVGINIPDVFITNTLMCRPEENRDPTADELSVCRQWLDSKIFLINPQIVIAVGRYATAHVLGENPAKIKITKLSGRPIPDGERLIVPIVHPSYVIRGGMRHYEYVEHMARIADAAQKMGLKGT